MTTTNNSSSATVSGGGSFAAVLLTIALGAAKIFGYLDISWWIVFLPMYAGFLILIAFLIIVGLVLGGAKAAEKRHRAALRKEREARQKQYDSAIHPEAVKVPSNRHYVR